MRVANGIPLGRSPLAAVDTVNSAQNSCCVGPIELLSGVRPEGWHHELCRNIQGTNG
jgi:hypothetical protein